MEENQSIGLYFVNNDGSVRCIGVSLIKLKEDEVVKRADTVGKKAGVVFDVVEKRKISQ